MKEWFNNLSASQRLVLMAVGSLAVSALTMVVGHSIGVRQGYRKGHADGTSPLKKADLDVAEKAGYNKGWVDGVWAYNPEVYSSGLRAGIELSNESNRQAFDVINQARLGSSAQVSREPA